MPSVPTGPGSSAGGFGVALEPGSVLVERYRVDRLIGEGGMGAVYLGEHLGTGKHVAIKVLRPALADESSRARFLQEARAASTIGHPGVVDVLDTGTTAEGALFLVMEHLVGESLGTRLRRGPRLTLSELGWIFDQVLEAVAAAHAAGVIHRDLKPDNLFWVTGARPTMKVLDFGLSKFRSGGSASQTASGVVMGTPLYMAPEQAQGARDVTAAADLYAIGAILYDALAGQPPYPGESFGEVLAKVLTAPYRPIASVRPDLPIPLAALVDQLLLRDPAARPADAATVRTSLAAALRDEENTDRSRPPPVAALLVTLPPGSVSASGTLPTLAPSKPSRRVRAKMPRDRRSQWRRGFIVVMGLFALGRFNTKCDWSGMAGRSKSSNLVPVAALPVDPRPVKDEPLGELEFVQLPRGVAITGCPPGSTDCSASEPRQAFSLPPFWISKTDTTLEAYQACLDAKACPAEVEHNQAEVAAEPYCVLDLEQDDHPMNCVKWDQAQAFCHWIGGELPTPAQWEYAARSGRDIKYPWGDAPLDATRANGCDQRCSQVNSPDVWKHIRKLSYSAPDVNDGYAATSPVGAFAAGATPWGLLDMAGDVAQWTLSDFTDPSHPDHALKEVRGGSYNGDVSNLLTTRRVGRDPALPSPTIGFRCVRPDPWR